uniref:Uncharacterized protein n=1 Tax=Setaria italica TaxID=4555 RepID=K4AHY2_SETIT
MGISSYHWTAVFYKQGRTPCFLFLESSRRFLSLRNGKQSLTTTPLGKSRRSNAT